MKDQKSNLVFSILLLVGVASGIFIAERIRRKIGLSKFFSMASETPDIDESRKK